jgi:hypothetical protein
MSLSGLDDDQEGAALFGAAPDGGPLATPVQSIGEKS